MSRKETLEQFGSCWEGLDDPRCGNAALHDFHELLMIALCCVLCGGQGAVDIRISTGNSYVAQKDSRCTRNRMVVFPVQPGDRSTGCADRA
jgi:hypothetical protein